VSSPTTYYLYLNGELIKATIDYDDIIKMVTGLMKMRKHSEIPYELEYQ